MTMVESTPLDKDKSSVGDVVKGEVRKLTCQCVKIPGEEGVVVQSEVAQSVKEKNEEKQVDEAFSGSVCEPVESEQDSELSQQSFHGNAASLKSCLACSKPCLKRVTCEKCCTGCYCSFECLEKNENHTTYCPIICEVQKLETTKRIAAEIFSVDSEKLPLKMKRKLIGLVGSCYKLSRTA